MPDGRTMASGDEGGNVLFWDLQTHEVKSRIKAHSGTINTIVFNKTGTKMLTAADDGTVSYGASIPEFSCRLSRPHTAG
jgi:WD40 repeat protein